MRQFMPCNFPRKCRRISEADLWRSPEFISYLGPVVLKGIISNKISDIILTFSTLTFIMGSKEWYLHCFQYIRVNAWNLVYQFVSLYRKTWVVFIYDPLNSFSLFPLKSYIQEVFWAVTSKGMVAQKVFSRAKGKMSGVCLYDKSKILDHPVSNSAGRLPPSVLHVVFGVIVITEEWPDKVFLVNDCPLLAARMRTRQPIMRSFRKS